MKHEDEDCPLVEKRIACEECRYPSSEAMYSSVDEYEIAELIADSRKSREIKLRAWDKGTEEMLKVGIWQLWNNEKPFKTETPSIYIELMQYTGLKDKHGKEIYEGDIVSYSREPCTCGCFKGTKEIGWIEYRQPQYIFVMMDAGHEFQYDIKNTSHIEVIGNIYENPELLEGEEC